MIQEDKSIENHLLTAIKWDSAIKHEDINISVLNKVVTLAGTVPTYRSKLAAEDNAWSVKGVRSVENNIAVKHLLTEDKSKDIELEFRIKSILHWNKDLETDNVQLEVVDGLVTLCGSVPYYWQKFRIADLISGLEHLNEISNQLAIISTSVRDDFAIGEEITKALLRSDFPDTGKIKIDVRDGHVTLSGEVGTTFASWQLRKIVGNTDGVNEISNQVTIKYENI